MSDQAIQTLAVFVLDSDKSARRLLARVEKIDENDQNVEIVDAAIADRTRLGRVKIHQTTDMAGMKGARRGAVLGVVAGAILLGPAGAVVGGAAGGVLNGLRNRLHDIGIDDKFMRSVTKEVGKGKSALFVLYEGRWATSIGLIEEVVRAEHALLIQSTISPENAAKLRAFVEPATEQLGGEEAVTDYEVEVPDAPAEAPAPAAAEAPPAAAPTTAVAEAAAPAAADDLTQLSGIGPKAEKALAAAGITTYKALSEANEPQLRHAIYEGDMVPSASLPTWPMQASYAAKGDWQGLMHYNQKAAEARHRAAKPAAAAAAAPVASPDDLTKLKGIGPRIETILNDGGVMTYDQLEHTSTDELREIIAAGGALPPSSLKTWRAQAAYAGNGDWDGLAKYNSGHGR